MSNRKDVRYSHREVKVPTASWIGHDVGYVRPGYWIQFRMPGEDHIHTGRAICVVDTLDWVIPEIKGHIVAAVIMPTCDSAAERWIDPAWVIRSTPHVPARLLEFMMSDFRDRETVIKRMEDGIPTGFQHYLVGAVPKADRRWEPATKLKLGEDSEDAKPESV
jgi:hypothetical protein